MTNKLKQNLRYNRADRKLFSKIYPSDPVERSLCKLHERREDLTKSIDAVFVCMADRGFRPGIDNRNPEFSADFDRILEFDKQREKIARQVGKLEKQGGITTEQALRSLCRINAGRGSQSY